jgi:hypothetical protein
MPILTKKLEVSACLSHQGSHGNPSSFWLPVPRGYIFYFGVLRSGFDAKKGNCLFDPKAFFTLHKKENF